jgi:phosphatidylserine decarboxylase
MLHQYIERETGRVRTERLFGDRLVNLLYARSLRSAPALFRALTSSRVSGFLGFIIFDASLGSALPGGWRFLRDLGMDLSECVEDPDRLDTPRKVFERQIRYWERRPMPDDPRAVVSPADARALAGSFSETSGLFLKDRFFVYEELLGRDRERWLEAFREGDFMVFRLTPDKYHYNHPPVAGKVADLYEIPGGCHACNPGAVVAEVTPYSKNRRVVTVIDTDVPGGTGVGLVAMVEVVALMIGDVIQCYSEERYRTPRPLSCGMSLRKGVPKSLYRPGSSTDVLLFQKGRVRFAEDIVRNMSCLAVSSRFSAGFGKPLVETEVRVRSPVAVADRGEEEEISRKGGPAWRT